MVRVSTSTLGKHEGEAVDEHQFGHGVQRRNPDDGAGCGDVLGDRRVRRAEDPGKRPGSRQADRTVPKLHRRIRFRVDLSRLAEFQCRLLCDPDAPAVTEENEVVEPVCLDGKRLGQGSLGMGDRRPEILADVRSEQRERGGREPGLYDGPLVGEVQADRLAGQGGKGRAAVCRYRHAGGEPVHTLEQPDDLGCRPAPAYRDEAVVAPSGRELGGGKRVGFASSSRLTKGRERSGHVERGATADGGDPLPWRREGIHHLPCERNGSRPARGLGRNFTRDFAHLGRL